MTATVIACFVAGFFAVAFVALWFTVAYRELLAKRRSIEGLYEQLCLHEQLYASARDGPDAGISQSMRNTNQMLYREGIKGYNELLRKPMNRLPALVFGFHPME